MRGVWTSGCMENYSACIMWTISTNRSHRTFENEEQSMQDIKTLFEYCTSIGGVSCNSIVDFLDLMSVCL